MAYDFTNKKFGNLTAKRIAKQDSSKHNYWECLCDCGTVVVVRAGDLLNGKKTMCNTCKKNLFNKTVSAISPIPIGNMSDDEDWLKSNNVKHRNIEDYDNVFDMREIKGEINILNAPIVFKLVHAITADLSFSRNNYKNGDSSLANLFDKHFHISESLDELSVCDWEVGDIIYTAPIYNLLTKQDKNDKTTYSSLFKCLSNLKEHAENTGNFYLAFPHICCGRDGLNWDIVVQMILELFAEDNFQIMLF